MSKEQLRIVAIIQVRMGSTRLPKKALKEVLDKPLLSYLTERVKRVAKIDEIVVATSVNESDLPIVEFCKLEKIPIYRGSEENVLDRFYQAAKIFQAQVVIRICGDCPLIDPSVIQTAIDFFSYHYPLYDYVSNTLNRTFPRGMDVEVFTFNALKRAALEATHPEDREHVTPFIYRNPQLFSLGSLVQGPELSNHRWTVDTEEDYQLISKILTALYPRNPLFTMQDILDLLKKHPEWAKINANIQQKKLRL